MYYVYMFPIMNPGQRGDDEKAAQHARTRAAPTTYVDLRPGKRPAPTVKWN